MLCQCPKLTPLQSRLLASVTAVALLVLIYWSLSNPHFAYAAELPLDGRGLLRNGEDHNWHRIRDGIELDKDEQFLHMEERSVDLYPIVARKVQTAQIQGNDIGTSGEIAPGNITIWEYPNSLLTANHSEISDGLPSELSGKREVNYHHNELRKRDDDSEKRRTGTTIYISANTCRQPIWNGTGTAGVAPPQLTLYVADSAGKKNLGPDGSGQDVYAFDKGFVNASVTSASGTWHMAVAAPELNKNFTGSWQYNLAVSIDDYYYAAEPVDPFLYLVDTDSNAALFVTDNLTDANSSDKVFQNWMNLTAPFTLFALNKNLTGVMGMENSFCGLSNFVSNHSQIMSSQNDLHGDGSHVQMGMITRGLGAKPKQQFYATNLNSSSEYMAFLALDGANGSSTSSGSGKVGGGGKVWGAGVDFKTKTDGNCQLLFNLTFCDQVAYAAPANPNRFGNFTDLQRFYENYTTTWWKPFNYTLAQVPCNTTSDAKYSLAKTCTDCKTAYKEWLCAVSIPRCEDFSKNESYLQPRNMGQAFINNTMLAPEVLTMNYIPMSDAPTVPGSNAFSQTFESSFATNRSRNADIDTHIQPGPYREVLPCEDLCYSLMRSCPSSMNFACPYRGRGLEASYGMRNDPRAPPGAVSCSYLGAVYYLNGSAGNGPLLLRAITFAAMAIIVLVIA